MAEAKETKNTKDAKNAAPPATEGAAAAPPAAKAPGKPGWIGPAIAIVLVLSAAVGCAYFGLRMLGGSTSSSQGEGHGAKQEEVNAFDNEIDIEKDAMYDLGEIIANPAKAELRRFAKVNVQIWVSSKDVEKLERAGMKQIMRESLETKLKSFEIQELNHQFIHTLVAKAFKEELNKELRKVFKAKDRDHTYVKRVVLNNLLVQ